ncbi:MAG: prolyl-tRNA synthetase associated domain-containing protein [Clostridia bacterium]|nr:prolyl-tRNA synthetase associated domain-containing protein [Clostridia bacterium]
MIMYISEIYRGRPADERSAAENASYDLLDSLAIEYERLDHDVTAAMEDCEAVGKILGIKICKNLFLTNRQKTDFYLLMIPGDKEFRTKDLSHQIGSARLSFAGADFMKAFLNIEPGSVSVLGLMNDKEGRVRLLIDKDVLKDDYIGCHPCKNTSSLKIKTSDLLEKILPSIKHEPFEVEL